MTLEEFKAKARVSRVRGERGEHGNVYDYMGIRYKKVKYFDRYRSRVHSEFYFKGERLESLKEFTNELSTINK